MESQPYHLSLFTYDAGKVPYNEKKQQDKTRPTGIYDNDSYEIEEHLYWCYPRIVFANSEDEAEQKFIRHISETATLPNHYDVSIGIDDAEDHEDEDDESGYSLIVVK